MQDLNWDDLRILLAMARGQSFAAAARQLRIDETTVARRLAVLSAQLDAPLTARGPGNRVTLTELGQRLAQRASEMEVSCQAIPDDMANLTGRVTGTLRLTTVPWIVDHLLIPALPVLRNAHPGLHLHLLSASRRLDLQMQEADVALRLARPDTGGQSLLIRKLATLSMGLYRSAAGTDEGWICFDTADKTPLPQSTWLAEIGLPGKRTLTVSDAMAAAKAAHAGLGTAILPQILARDMVGLVAVDRPDLPPLPERELWLVVPKAQADHARMRAIIDWLDGLNWK